jgi:hypothetical protein
LVISIISTLRRLWQEDHEFEISLGYKVRRCLKIYPCSKKKGATYKKGENIFLIRD